MAKAFRTTIVGLFIAAFCSSLVAEQGMTVHTVPSGSISKWSNAPMVLRFLSNKDTVLLSSGNSAWGPCFSPDGKKVAYGYNSKMLYVVDVDGKNRMPLCSLCTTRGSKEPYVSWCNNGYIYWSQCDRYLRRIKADGSVRKEEIVFTSTRCQPPQPVEDECWDLHNMQVNIKATLAAWTKPPKDLLGDPWWSNSILSLDKTPLTEIDWQSGCQCSVSPSGNLVTRSNGSHDYWYLLKPLPPPNNQLWKDCSNAQCPLFVYGAPNPAGLRHQIIRWSQNDSNIICFSSEPTDANESDVNTKVGHIYNIATKTTIAVGRGNVWDYYKQEIRNPSAVAAPAGTRLNRGDASARFLRATDGTLRIQALASGVLTVSGLRGELIERRYVTSGAVATVAAAGGCRMVRFTSDAGSTRMVWKGMSVATR